jgi:DNA repair protein RadC
MNNIDRINVDEHIVLIRQSSLFIDFSELPNEEFCMLLLNRANKIVKTVKVSEGGISGTVVDHKKIFFIALEHHASSIILGHYVKLYIRATIIRRGHALQVKPI